MDQDTLEFVRTLCCRAGILMEDTSVLAVAPPRNKTELQKLVRKLDASIDSMRAIVEAAKALMI